MEFVRPGFDAFLGLEPYTSSENGATASRLRIHVVKAALNQAPVDGPDTAQKGLVRAMRCVCFHQYINCSNTQTNHKLKSDGARWVATQSRARRHPQAIAPNDALTG